MATLRNTVFVRDPDRHATVVLRAGEEPEPRLAALVTNPDAWVDGKLPNLPKTGGDSSRAGSGPDAASGDASAPGDADTKSDESDDSEDTKPAARKTAAKKPARGRSAAAEGTGGQ
ncbi:MULTISPECIES: hypothetical protein [unclassified Streptomyces]|uniref:hypothetical protein n=1 Tax=unclassified Streptomyces TaxID=2593676 RepID=UPI000805B9CA|nr:MULTISPECIES: hypothetical protein [unclassified Streptomyces]MYR75181.1 hypothetical protein [Streptomyces sp. SID4925]SBU98111.1 hypothetical protein YUMDRAFT_06057 [Streptomyces sp. OspMP-M45]